MRPAAFAAIVVALALPAGAALAETAPVAATKDQATADQIEAWLREAPPVELEPEGAPGVIAGGGAPDRQVHGEVSVAVGTGGYRSIYMASAIPVGDDDTLYIAVGESRGGARHGPYGGTRRSLSIGLDLSADRAPGEVDCREAAGPSRWKARPPRRFGVDAEAVCPR